MTALQSYAHGTSGVHAANNEVKLRMGRDSATADEPVLIVEYPERTQDPAGRDVWCDAETTDWTVARAISFQIRSAKPERISLSFFDRNRVVYTTWFDIRAGVWQPVSVVFEQLRPNPYFQPSDAKTGTVIDVSKVERFAFAPQGPAAGELVVSGFVLSA